jgi:hypothetical protein
MGETGLYPEQ